MHKLAINRLKADFRKIEPFVEGNEGLNASMSDGFEKVVDSLELCSPKTRRIADRILGICQRIDYPDFNRVLVRSLFEPDGQLKKGPPEKLIARLFSDLNDFCKTQKNGHAGKWMPLTDLLN